MVQKSPVVLFADRDLLRTRRVRSELRRCGAEVLTAPSADEALRLIDDRAPDLLVLDESVAQEGLADLVNRRAPSVRILRVGMPDERGRRVSRGEIDTARLLRLIHALLGVRLAEPVAPERPKPLVLCVDDDRFFLNSLERLLVRQGYRVAGFEDPEHALESIPELAPDLAILDVAMPGMDGLDLAAEIQRSFGGRIPVVLLTARAGDEDIIAGYHRGATYYITKPCDPHKVMNIVDYLVGDLDTQERLMLERQL